MSDFVPSVIAVLGTLGGSVVAYLFGERSRERERDNTVRETARQERLAAYAEFVAVVNEYRRAQRDRWQSRDGGVPDAEDPARQEAYRQRARGRSALARIELIARPDVDGETVEAARRAFVDTEEMRRSDSRQKVNDQSEQARRSLDAFIAVAAASVRHP